MRAAGNVFSLIISDVIMPNMSGPELVALVVLEAPRLRLLFITGSAGAERREASRLGPVLAKPFTGPELLAAVRSAIK